MISSTEKNPNPKTSPTGKFLRSLQSHVSAGYVGLRNGQIIRRDTMERWEAGLPSRKQVKAAAKSKPIPELPMSRRELGEMFGNKALPGSKKRKLKAVQYQQRQGRGYFKEPL